VAAPRTGSAHAQHPRLTEKVRQCLIFCKSVGLMHVPVQWGGFFTVTKNRIAMKKTKKNKTLFFTQTSTKTEKVRTASLFSRYTIDFLCEEDIEQNKFLRFI
jgi:hypothetical protein